MYGYQYTSQIPKSQVAASSLSSATANGASRPATSFSNKFYKPGEENAAVIATTGTPGGMVNSTAMTKQLPYHQKKTPTRGNSNKLPEISSQQGSAKKSEKIGNGSGVYSSTTSSQSNVSGGSTITQLSNEFNEIAQNEKDERFRYLLKHGTLRRIELNGNIIFCELPQIMGIWVCYRRPIEREANTEKLNLDCMELTHMPLLEGEEKLKILTYQHNKIVKIENLVSLPYLLYLDLYDNQLREIDSLAALLQLRVLLLPKNNITRIQSIDHLSKLEVLDLHSNKIQRIEGIKSLVNLKILNLANNLIVKLENLESQVNLVELNLKLNLIEKIEGITHIQKLEKLFLQNNRIDSLEGIKCLKSIPSLLELNLDGNPLSKNLLLPTYQKFVLANTVNLRTLDHKLTDLIREDLKKESQQAEIDDKNGKNQSLTNTSTGNISTLQSMKQQDNKAEQNSEEPERDQDDEDINPEEVISIIGEQWKLELQRVRQLELQNAKKKDYMQNILVEGGHAEIEDDSSLFIYGNAYEIVLCNEQFQDVIEKIQFQYILFDFIIENTTLVTLKNFKKLKEIVLKDNYLVTLLQLAKLEILPSLRSISLSNNPLQKCSFLKEFIVYRFPTISRINGIDVKEADKLKAKNLFSNFDRILQLPEKFYNAENMRVYPCQNTDQQTSRDKQFMKVYSKAAADTAETFTNDCFNSIIGEKLVEQNFEKLFDEYINSLIEQTQVFNPQQHNINKHQHKRNPSPYRQYI